MTYIYSVLSVYPLGRKIQSSC